MKEFEMMKVLDAIAWSAAGGQALHLMNHSGGLYSYRERVPECFKRTKTFGHLFDQDEERLEATARRLGVRRVVVAKRGTKRQHVDLCGRPLERAMVEARWQAGGDP